MASKQIITSIVTENNIQLDDHKQIQQYASNFYKELYSKAHCNIEKQNHFLSFIRNELNDQDREMLSASLTKQEFKKNIKLSISYSNYIIQEQLLIMSIC